MSRYIDADELIRYGKCGTLVYWEDIENAPSTDIVRCGECKHYHVEKYHTYCDFLNIRGMFPPDPHPDDFCSYGCRDSEKPNNSTRSKMEQVGKERSE